jgi:hypothetical protein
MAARLAEEPGGARWLESCCYGQSRVIIWVDEAAPPFVFEPAKIAKRDPHC